MKLTKEQDYAIRIVYELFKTNSKMTVAEVSEKTGVTPLFTQKIMRKLSSAGLVTSVKGNQGGYIVTLPSSDVSIYDVFKAINGDLYINACLDPESGCCSRPGIEGAKGGCVIRRAIGILNKDLISSLKKITFESLLEDELK